jgi:hypothetical protein
MNEIRGTDIFGPDQHGAVITQLCLHPSLWRLAPELDPKLPVNPIDLIDVNTPADPMQQT